MSRQELHKKIHYLTLTGIAFTMSVNIRLNSLMILLCAANWIIEGNFSAKIKTTFSNKMNIYWMSFFMLHILSYLVSANQHEAGAIIERRLSMLAFPLLIFGSVSAVQARNISYSFIAGVITALIFCYATAFRNYFLYHHPNVFFYHDLTSAVKMNAVYMSAYVVFCIHLLLHFVNWPEKIQKITALVFLSFLGISCFMLSSKMMLFVLMVGLMFRVFRSGSIKNKVRAMGIAAGIAILIVAGILTIHHTRERFSAEFTSDFSVLHTRQFRYDTHFTGTSLRLVIWKYCYELMREKNAWFTGVGTGDFQDMLNEKYRSTGMYTGNPVFHDTGYLGFGPHDEYIEVILTFGVPVFLFFLFILFSQWSVALKSNHYLLTELLIIFTLFCVTESVLSTNKGIVFLMFFISLLTKREGSLNREKQK